MIASIPIQLKSRQSIYCVKSNITVLKCHNRGEACQAFPTHTRSFLFYYSIIIQKNTTFSVVCASSDLLIYCQPTDTRNIGSCNQVNSWRHVRARFSPHTHKHRKNKQFQRGNTLKIHTDTQSKCTKRKRQCQVQPSGRQLNPKSLSSRNHFVIWHLLSDWSAFTTKGSNWPEYI